MIGAIAPTAALLLTSLLIWLAIKSGIAYRFLDAPNHRSLHSYPTPHIGGEAIAIAIGIVVVTSALLPWPIALTSQATYLLTGGAILALTGALDDRFKLPVAPRLFAQALAALIALWCLALPSQWYWLVLMAIAIIWSTNLYNFMDGADGIAGTTALIGFGTFYFAAPATIWGYLSLIIAAASLGFLSFNWSPAKTFMGDAGSTSLGYLAVTIGLAGIAQDNWPIWFVPLVFFSFLFDSAYTLLRRLINREKFWQAHRSHLYQRLVQTGWSHGRLCFWMAVTQGVCCLSAIVTNLYSPQLGSTMLLCAAAWHIGVAVWIQSRWNTHLANVQASNQ